MATERTRVPSMGRGYARSAASGGFDTDRGSIQPSSGFTPQPVVEVQTGNQMIDYYRNGDIEVGGGQTIVNQYPKTLVEREETTASIRVYGRGTGKGASNQSQSAKPERDFIPPYTKLILQGAQESHQERSQIVETFGEFYLFFYGQRPPVYTFNGTLINAKNVNWVSDFYFYYENYMRGTKCVESNSRIILTYGGRQIEGYILEMGMRTDAAVEMGVPVTFQVVVTKRNDVSFSNDFGLYADYFGSTTVDETLVAMLDSVAGKEGKGTSEVVTSEAFNATKNVMDKSSPAAGPYGGLSGFGGSAVA